MEVLRKDEDEWWYAKHSDGRLGCIPVPYVQIVSLLNLNAIQALIIKPFQHDSGNVTHIHNDLLI